MASTRAVFFRSREIARHGGKITNKSWTHSARNLGLFAYKKSFSPCVQIGHTVQGKDVWKNIPSISACHLYSSQITHEEGTKEDNTPHVEDLLQDEFSSPSHVIEDTEKIQGPSKHHEFQAETRQLLDIVAKSLYSEKDVFIREIISNSSDALEKLRHLQVTGAQFSEDHRELEIHLSTDEEKGLFIIQDFGIGMTEEDLIENIGTIARSGSKKFAEAAASQTSNSADNIIGQFGVGFYSTFMVGDKIDVYTKHCDPGSKGYFWTSDGSGTYSIAEADGVVRGTKVIIHLKEEDKRFASKSVVEEMIKRYSNFVGFPIFLHGTRLNTIQPLWLQIDKEVSQENHEEFYKFITNTYDTPRYNFMYKADAPLNIRSALYIPTRVPETFGLKHMEHGVSLYCRKVLISKNEKFLPEWLRFMRGVVDSEDIPLNLSREMLQNSALVRKISGVLQSKVLRYLHDQQKKDSSDFLDFMKEFGNFFREGIVADGQSASTKEEIAKLFSFESSKLLPDEKKTLKEYISDMKDDQNEIYFLCAPNRILAESSPYIEALKKKDVEILFTYDENDEIVFLRLAEFEKKKLISAENFLMTSEDTKDDSAPVEEKDALTSSQSDRLMEWIETVLGKEKVNAIKVSHRLESHPAMITVPDMTSARQWLRYMKSRTNDDEMMKMKFAVLQPTLEINPNHEVVIALFKLKNKNPALADLLANQLYDNAMISAGLMDDPREMVGRLTSLLSQVLKEFTDDTATTADILSDDSE